MNNKQIDKLIRRRRESRYVSRLFTRMLTGGAGILATGCVISGDTTNAIIVLSFALAFLHLEYERAVK